MKSAEWRTQDCALAALLALLAALAAYHNCFSVPFLFDDEPSILENPTLRHLWPITRPLSPPPGSATVCGRPLLNLSLAINYALGGNSVLGYHAMNLLIHALASLTLMGVTRRTLVQPVLVNRFGAVSAPLATAVAVLWAVHPLQTESVTYIVQRAESLMGLFYLLTLYCFIRAVPPHSISNSKSQISNLWYVLSIAACFLGMATKEVMASAPIMALLYDRTFVAGSFREALRRRWPFYAGLACSWLMLGWLAATAGKMGDSAGFGSAVDWKRYATAEFWAVAHYLRLALWPQRLVLDYGGAVVIQPAIRVLPCALVIIALIGVTLIGLYRRSATGFLGCWFFGILALTSSVFPLMDAVFEHRMYLPLAAVVVLMVTAIHSLTGRWSRGCFVLLALVYIGLSIRRNEDYRSGLTIWSDTVAKRPNNARAHYNLANALVADGRLDEGIAHFDKALEIQPGYQDARENLGSALAQQGRLDEALVCFQKGLQLNPRSAPAHNNLASVFQREGLLAKAIEEYKAAADLEPQNVEFCNNLGVALAADGRLDAAIQQFLTATRLKPEDARACNNLGNAFAAKGNAGEAIAYFRRAIEVNPNFAEAQNNFANLLAGQGSFADAISHYQQAIRINPKYARAYYNLSLALVRTGNAGQAALELKEALRLNPDYTEARELLTNLAPRESP